MLISPEYREQQETMHENPDYGRASEIYAPFVSTVIKQFQVTELLDYGAGKGRLKEGLELAPGHVLTVDHYDPAIPAWSEAPSPCEMVACIDVLEHIEPDCLDAVLDHLKELTLRVGFFSVHTEAAVKTLPDGRNAHLIQEGPEWWLPKLMERFTLVSYSLMGPGFWVVVNGI